LSRIQTPPPFSIIVPASNGRGKWQEPDFFCFASVFVDDLHIDTTETTSIDGEEDSSEAGMGHVTASRLKCSPWFIKNHRQDYSLPRKIFYSQSSRQRQCAWPPSDAFDVL